MLLRQLLNSILFASVEDPSEMSVNLTLEQFKQEKVRRAQGAWDENFYSWSMWNMLYRDYLAGDDRELKPAKIEGVSDPRNHLPVLKDEKTLRNEYAIIHSQLPYAAGKSVNYTRQQLPAVLVTEYNFYPVRYESDWDSIYDTYIHNGLSLQTVDKQHAIEKMTKEADDFKRQQAIKEKARVEELMRLGREKEMRDQWMMYYERWYSHVRDQFVERWKKKYANYTRKQFYEKLIHNTLGLAASFGILVSAAVGQGREAPWLQINAYIGHVAPDPDDKKDQYAIDLYYDKTLPEAGMMVDWYNTPGVDLGNPFQRVQLYYKFGWSPLAEIQADIALVKRKGKELEEDSAPYLLIAAGVIGVVGLSYVTHKVTQ